MFTIYDDEKENFSQVEEPDASVSYTYADYLQWKYEERLELFRGRIFKLSAPNTKHQVVAGNLFVLAKNFLAKQKCRVFRLMHACQAGRKSPMV